MSSSCMFILTSAARDEQVFLRNRAFYLLSRCIRRPSNTYFPFFQKFRPLDIQLHVSDMKNLRLRDKACEKYPDSEELSHVPSEASRVTITAKDIDTYYL